MTTLVAGGNFGLSDPIGEQPAIEAIRNLSSGQLLVTYTVQSALYSQVLDAIGQPVGSPLLLDATGYQSQITNLATGGYAISWADTISTTSSNNLALHVKLFDSSGTALGDDIIVDTRIYGINTPNLTALPNGGFVVDWDTRLGGTQPASYIRAYNAAGQATTGLVTAYTAPNFGAVTPESRVTTLADGRVLISYSTGSGIFVKTFDPASGAIGSSNFATHPGYPGANYQQVHVTQLSSSNVLVSWSEVFLNNSILHGEIYDTAGAFTGKTFTIPSNSNYSSGAVSALPDGGFIFEYSGTNADLFGQVFNADAQPVGDAFQISSSGENARTPIVDAYGANNFVSAYSYYDASTIFHSAIRFAVTPIRGTAAGESVTGTSGSDIIFGLAGDDSLYGLGGNDILSGGLGADLLDGGSGIDTADYSTSTAGVQVSLLTNVGHGGDAEGDTLISIENLVGSAFNDTLIGDAGSNRLEGGAGDDTLDGGVGADTMIGGAGADLYYVDNVGDVVIELAGEGRDQIITSVTYTAPDNVEILALAPGATGTLFANGTGTTLIGNERANILQGAGGDDTLDGGAGADTMTGGSGNDIYYVDNASDVVVEQPNGGTDIVYTTVNYVMPANVEQLMAAPAATAALTLTGNAGNNVITLGQGGGAAYGLDGNDILTNGRYGPSLLDGGAGYDTVNLNYESLVGYRGPTLTFADNGDLVFDTPSGTVTTRNVEVVNYAGGSLYTSYLRDIDAQYATYGGRHATLGEFSVWSSSLNGGASISTVRTAILNDPLGKPYVDAQIAQAYQTYGGRAPVGNELQVWENALPGNGYNFGAVKSAILNDSLGVNYSAAKIGQIYQEYGGRAPVGGEVQVWQNALRTGASFDTVRQAILNDPLGQGHTLAATTALYQSYLGRAPNSAELNAAQASLLTGSDFAGLRGTILADPSIHAYELQQISQAYQTYGGRAPSGDELTVWDNALRGGATYASVRLAILADPLGKTYVDGQITAAYQTYGGRVPIGNELQVWENALKTNGYDFSIVKNAIIADPLGRPYVDAQITQAYQTYGGRAPVGNELQVWENALKANGYDFSIVKKAIIADPLGKPYVDAQITAAYQTYGGRAPVGNELQVWENVLGGNKYDFSAVKVAILDDPLGQAHSDTTITSLYQRYFNRAPSGGELQTWKYNLRAGADFDTLRDALLSDAGSSATGVQQVQATSAADAVQLSATFHDVVFTGFDPAADTISLRNTPFAGVDPLAGGRARQISAPSGDQDVLITFDDQHSLLLHHVQLGQLSAADFLI